MYKKGFRSQLPMAMLGLCLTPHQPTNAQEPQQRPQLEEVIVTAQKRKQNLKDVPVAITALGREMLKDNDINNVRDLSKIVPSLQFTESSTPVNEPIRIRGVGTDVQTPTVEPNVAVLVDGVPLARTEMINFEFADLERIEVLRGPQGTLFGKNSTAGLVHVITRDPAPEFEAFVRTGYEEPQDWPGGQFITQLGVSGPLTETLGGRISGFYKEVDGHLIDVVQNDNPPDSKSGGVRGKLRWDPIESVAVTLSLESQRNEGASTPFVFRSVNPDKAAREEEDIEFGEKNRQTKTFGRDAVDIDNDAVSLTIDWNIGSVTLSSITGYRDFLLFRNQTAPGVTGDRLDVVFSAGDRAYQTFTQELRLTSAQPSVLEYTVGALWFNNEMDDLLGLRAQDIPASLAVQGSGAEGFLDFLDTLPGNSDSLTQTFHFEGGAVTKNLGLFGQLTWHITDRWHLTAGARHVDEEQTAEGATKEVVIHEASGTVISEETQNPSKTTISDTAVIGRLSLQYDWTEHTTLYSTFSTGYRGGAIDTQASDIEEAFADPVDPETSESIELGSKSRLFDERLELNIAVFQTVFEDFQAQMVHDQGAGGLTNVGVPLVFRLDNASELETRGVEIDVKARPLASLTLTGSFLYNKAEFNEFVGECFVGQRPGESGGRDVNGDGNCDQQDISGGTLPNAPEFSASLLTRYERPLGDGSHSAFAQLTGRWQDDVQFNATQHPGTIQEAYQVWDLRLGWRGLGDRLAVAISVKNLFDQFYVGGMRPLSVVNDRRDVVHFVPRDANRQFGASVSYEW